MTRRAAIAALALAALFAAVGARDAHAEWVTEVVTNRVEYDGVEYLQFPTTAYIDTGVDAGFNNGFEVDMAFPNTLGSSDSWRFGWVAVFPDIFQINYDPSIATINFWCFASRLELTYKWKNYGAENRWMRFGVFNYGYYVDGVKLATPTTTQSSTKMRFYLGIRNNNGTLQTGTVIARYRNFKMFESSATIRDLIPVLDGTTPKMLNLVDGRLYANAGSGSFTYGAVTGKVAYVSVTTNRVYRAPAPMRSYDAQHPFNAPTARTRLGGTGSGEDGTTLRPTAHFDIKRNEED